MAKTFKKIKICIEISRLRRKKILRPKLVACFGFFVEIFIAFTFKLPSGSFNAKIKKAKQIENLT